MKVSIRFSNFWKNSDSTLFNFFVPLIETVYQSEVYVEKDSKKLVDLEVFSVFPQKKPITSRALNRISNFTRETSKLMEIGMDSNARRKLWFSGENKRTPIADQFDSYLGYDPEGLLTNSHYFPLWVLNLDNFGRGVAHGFTSAYTNQDALLLPRILERSSKTNFCCAFIGNPTSFRLGVLRELGKIEPLGLFGSAFGKQILDKNSVSNSYKFSFSFENNLFPGYVTEKLLEGYLGGNVPLYWGIDSSSYFNPRAFINLNDFYSLEDFVAAIREINSNEDRYIETYNQPLLLRKFDIDDLVNMLRKDLL